MKNLNSFRNVERALAFEIERHIAVLDAGGTIVQQTLLWDAGRGETVPMRGKEDAHDYRYFPEPDLPAVAVAPERITALREHLPELPLALRDRLAAQYGIPLYDAGVLTAERPMAMYFEQVARALKSPSRETWKMAANWVMGDVLRVMKEERRGFENPVVPAAAIADLIDRVHEGAISGKIAKDVFEEMRTSGDSPAAVIERKGLAQVSDEGALEALARAALETHPDSVALYRSGRTNVLGFFVGEVMKATRGQANPAIVNRLLKDMLHGD